MTDTPPHSPPLQPPSSGNGIGPRDDLRTLADRSTPAGPAGPAGVLTDQVLTRLRLRPTSCRRVAGLGCRSEPQPRVRAAS